MKIMLLNMVLMVLSMAVDYVAAISEDPTIVDSDVYCYSCLTRPPMFGRMNMTKLRLMLTHNGITLPDEVKQCKDTPAIARPDFRASQVAFCGKSNVCVKFKGSLLNYEGKDEQFVVRNCYDRMWINSSFHYAIPAKPGVGDLSEWCVTGAGVEEFRRFPFLQTANHTAVCFCDRDLCNHPAHNHTHLGIFMLIHVFLSLPLLLLWR